MMIGLGVTVAVVLIIAFVIRQVLRRGQDVRQLSENGFAVVATVTEKKAQRRSRVEDYYFVTYTFRASDGNEYHRKFQVRELEFANYTEGMPINVVYLPADPSVNALESTVAQMRAAMTQAR